MSNVYLATKGKILPNVSESECKERLASRLKLSEGTIEKIFSGSEVIIKNKGMS